MRDAIKGMNGQNLYGRNITVIEIQSRGSGGGSVYYHGGIDDSRYGGGRYVGGYKKPLSKSPNRASHAAVHRTFFGGLPWLNVWVAGGE